MREDFYTNIQIPAKREGKKEFTTTSLQKVAKLETLYKLVEKNVNTTCTYQCHVLRTAGASRELEWAPLDSIWRMKPIGRLLCFTV